MTDRGTPTPQEMTRNRRMRRVVNGIMLAGTLVFAGGMADSIINTGDQSAYNVVRSYEDTAQSLGKQGEIAKLADKFNSQEVAASYVIYDAQEERRIFDMFGALGGGLIALIAWAAPARDERQYPTRLPQRNRRGNQD